MNDKEIEIISEAWQAMSVLSDAQEFLDEPDRCNNHINHAKRHLIRAFELAREEDEAAFRKGLLLIGCTLQEGEGHDVQVLLATEFICPLTEDGLAELYGELKIKHGFASAPPWEDLSVARRQEVKQIAEALLYVEEGGMNSAFDTALGDRLLSLLWNWSEEDC